MEQNYQSTKLPTVGASSAIGGASAWSNPSRITADDDSSASWGAFAGGQQSAITGSVFDFQELPDSAIIDGLAVYVDGSQIGCYGNVELNISGSVGKAIGAFGGYGGPTDKWGLTEITEADLAALTVTVQANDVSGGDGIASIDYISVTVFWHLELPQAPADVPTRVDYKVYSREGRYLGLLPEVNSPFVFPQDMNAAGAAIEITCGVKAENRLTTEAIITGDGEDIITGTGDPLLATVGEIMLAQGASESDAIFKNSNRIKVWMYNYWYPNGKLMFSGQVNKVRPKFAGGKSYTKLTVLSDGLDLNNLVARGYPFAYSTDVSQTTNNLYAIAHNFSGDKSAGWEYYGQTWVTGGGVTNIGAICLLLAGTADVTVWVYDGPNGNLLGSTTKSVALGSPTEVQFEFPQLIPVSPNTGYFFAVTLGNGQDLSMYYNNPSVYTDGAMYGSSYGGGSGGGSYFPLAGDLYFITKSGLPTTTATYSTQDPVSGMMAAILTDYNNRGGYITERDFTPAGYTLTYTFNMAYILDALKKVLEMSPSGYTSYIDLGTAEMDIFPISETADFTVVNDKDIVDLDLELSIEQVKNYLLLTGGDTGGGTNLFRDYTDNQSSAAFGIRTGTKSDNRMTQTTTADAIGESYIDENADEAQNTSLVVPVTAMDHTLLTPGKTIGFKNFGNFIDTFVLPIVRREFHTKYTVLTLGKMPVRQSDELQRINRGLLDEQTVNNPSAPS